ncbi:MAG: hypothetical protein M0C28_23295 [Candidatus Moduliflexus flocculans]|nr:hypothetical protein [Candidatus Moduliflexus flocculans]
MLFTVSTRVEDDNTTRTETWLVPAGAASPPQRLVHYGRDIAGARWTDDDRVAHAADSGGHGRIDPQSPARSTRAQPRRRRSGGVRAGSAGCGRGPAGGRPRQPEWRVDGGGDRRPVSAKPERIPGPRTSSGGTRSASRASRLRLEGPSSGTASRFPAPNPRARPAAQIAVTPAGRAARGARRSVDARTCVHPAWPGIPDGLRLGLHRRSGLARRTQVREPRPLGW